MYQAPSDKRSGSAPRLSVIGAPSSAGAYAPGQERAPAALRDAGLIDRLRGFGIDVQDLGDTETRAPLLRPDQVLYFAIDNVEPFERQLIRDLEIENVSLGQVAREPMGAAERVVNGWSRKFSRLLIHLDVDVLDFADMPLAENTRRNVGLTFDQLVAALRVFLSAPNWTALTVCELNPDHGLSDGSTLRTFVAALSDAIAAAARLDVGRVLSR